MKRRSKVSAATLWAMPTFQGTLQIASLPGYRMLAGKLDATGTAAWMVAGSGNNFGGQVFAIQAHPSGKILVSGVLPYGTPVSFAGFTTLDTLGSQYFLTLLDTLGAGIWFEKVPRALTTYGFGLEIMWEDADHVLVGGGYQSGGSVE
jgi:hypothetical protein